MRQVDEVWKIPDEVASATRERAFVRTVDGWERRPPNPNRFWDFMNVEDGTVDPLAMLRQITGKVVYVLCRPPGDAGMFATGRAGLERHLQAIAADRPNIGIETIAATHGVMFEQPDVIAAMVQALVTA